MRSLAIVPTRVAAATPTWATSSTRLETPASWLVTTLSRRGRVTLDGGAVAADDALQAGAGLLDVALELVAGLDAATLVAGLELLELALGLLAGAERVGERAGGLDHAVARLERGADVGERGALGERLALLRRGAGGADVGLGGARASRCLACVRTRRPVVFDGVVAVVRRVVRRAAGLRLRAAGLRLAAAGFFAAAGSWRWSWWWCWCVSAMWLSPCPEVRVRICVRLSASRRTYVRKPKSWTGYSGLADFVARSVATRVNGP